MRVLSAIEIVTMINISWLEIILFLSVVYVRSTETASCPQSQPTMSRVPSCPKSKEEWDRRADAKQCSLLQQQCQNDGEFVYHCVINIFANETLEVCAPKVKIIGWSCVEYNVRGAVIQQSHYVKCRNSCPFSYNSTEVYNYQDCFKTNSTDNLNKLSTKASLNSNFNSNISSCVQEDCTYPASSAWQIVALLMIAINVIVFILILWLIFRKRDRKRRKNKGKIYKMVARSGTNKSTEGDLSNTDTINPSNYATVTQGIHVAAIDIGDTYLTMALSEPQSPEDIKPLGSIERMCFLLDSKGDARLFGAQALDEYIRETTTSEKNEDICQFKLFKLSDVEDKYYNGALSSIMERAEDELLNALPCVQQSNIYFVFVVPNYWTDEAIEKLNVELSKMEKFKSTFCVIKRKLTLSPFIHEVKARVVCLNFNVDNLVLRPGSESNTYAILHIGSTHYDLIFERVGKDQNDSDSSVPNPKPWKRLPKDSVVNFFGNIFKEEAMKKWEKDFNLEYVSFLLQFEKVVQKTDECTTDNDKLAIKLPKKLLKIAKEKNIEKKIKTTNGIHLGENNWTFEIEFSLLKTFFAGIRGDVREKLNESWKYFESENVKCVVMTGAYSKRKIIWDIAEKDWFKNKKVTVVVPDDSHVFAMGGAYYGQKSKGREKIN